MTSSRESRNYDAPLKLDDGFGNVHECPHGLPEGVCEMEILRPGKTQCACDGGIQDVMRELACARSRWAKERIENVRSIQSETALISSLAMRCRPAVAHYMRTQERAAMSKALSPAAKEAAEKEAAWQGKLLDEIDNLIGARQVPPHRSGGGHG